MAKQPRQSLKPLMPPPEEKPDPALKLKIREAVLELAFAPARNYATKILDAIIEDHMKLEGNLLPYFVYLGERYVISTQLINPRDFPRVMPRLHHSLRDRMDQWIRDFSSLDIEMENCRSAMATILNQSNHVYDYRELLPEGVHGALNAFMSETWRFTRLTPEKLAQAKIDTQASADLIRCRLASNLLY